MSYKTDISTESFAQLTPHRLNAATRVIEFIAAHPNKTVKEIAKGTNLTNSAVRYIVSDLLSQDIIDSRSSLDLPGKRGRGRPSSLYVLKKALLIATPPRRYWQLSDRLIATLLDELGSDVTERLFQSMGINAAEATAERWSQTSRIPMSLESFGRKLRQELNMVGYNAHLTVRNKRIIITTKNCLYGEVSRKYEGLLCNFHTTYYPKLLSLVCHLDVQTIGRKGCMARGDAQCGIELLAT
ncbi:MAG: winged helix-turn-helix transcriptional regulator [Candidatus Hodarchaeota archaeon]